MGFLVFASYDGAFKSSVTVKTQSLPINNLEELIDSSMNVILYQGNAFEQGFTNAEEGTLENEFYKKKLAGTKRVHDYENLDEIVTEIMAGESVYMDDIALMAIKQAYPCDIIDVKSMTYAQIRYLLF